MTLTPFRFAMCTILAASMSVGALAQGSTELPFEKVGIVQAALPATSTIIVGERKLIVTSATKIRSDSPAPAYASISSAWVGKQVTYSTETASNGNLLVTQLHILTDGDR